MPNQTPQPAVVQPDQIAGLVERVTFHNDESGFSVLRIKARGHRELVTVVGTLPEVRAGEWFEAQGRWTVKGRARCRAVFRWACTWPIRRCRKAA